MENNTFNKVYHNTIANVLGHNYSPPNFQICIYYVRVKIFVATGTTVSRLPKAKTLGSNKIYLSATTCIYIIPNMSVVRKIHYYYIVGFIPLFQYKNRISMSY